MLNKLFASKMELKHNLGYCKLYDTKYNHTACTKMYFISDSPAKYELLRSVSHYNILPVYKITQHSIFTKRVVPFSTVYNKEHRKYNEYVISKLKDTLLYMNETLGIEHHNLVMDALFTDNYGNVLIGKFDRVTEYKDGNDDKNLLNELSRHILGVELDEVGDGGEIFKILENREAFFKLEIKDKERFVEDILLIKDELPHCVVCTIFHLLLDDIAHSNNEGYKLFVLESLRKLDSDVLASFSKKLFSILDSPIRMYLLQHYSGLGNLNECVEEICLGLRVKEKPMKIATIDFIFKNEHVFDTAAFTTILRTMQEHITDTESISAVCVRITRLARADVYKPIYKLIIHFTILGKARSLAYKCVEVFFREFDKFKVSTELLPLLCSRLSDVESQDACFSLVEKIFSFLKENRNDLKAKEWSIKSIKGMFGSKTDVTSDSDSLAAGKRSEDGWEPRDL